MKFFGLILTLLFVIKIAFSSATSFNESKYISKDEFEAFYDSLENEEVNFKFIADSLLNENKSLTNKINIINEKVNQSISRESNYISFITWASGIVIAFVGLVFAFVAVLIYTGNRKIIKDSQKMLNDAEKLKTDFESWFKKRQKKYQEAIQSDYKQALIIIQNTTKFEKLKKLLKGKKLEPKEIYPLVTSLAFNPLYEYKSYFNKLIKMNISEEITGLAEKGLEKLKEEKKES